MRSPRLRRLVLLTTLGSLLALPTFAFGGTPINITVEPTPGSYTFSPDTASGQVGSAFFHWTWDTSGTTVATHNVRQTDKLFYSGALTASNPSGFDVNASAGTFHYFCEHHVALGMKGVVKVSPTANPSGTNPFPVTWATESTNTGTAFDVRYRIDGGNWKTWKNDTSKFSATFGNNGKPVTVKAGHTYDFQARSEKASNPDKKSNWSPKLSVST